MIQTVKVEEGDLVRLEKCQHCGRKVRPGQVVLVKHGWANVHVQRDFVVHVRCMRYILAEAPPEQDQIAYEELREKIVVSGLAFPEE